MPKCEIATTLHCAAIFLIDSGGCIVLQLYVVYEVRFCHNGAKVVILFDFQKSRYKTMCSALWGTQDVHFRH